MPGHVHAAHVGLGVLRPVGVSNAGAMPTKLGEFLAAGRPVVVSPGLGDMDRFLSDFDCGVVLTDMSAVGLGHAAEEVERLIDDPDTPTRCRALAEERFSLPAGVKRLLAAYEKAVTR
jgi:glycosyltransferase involved in cell wall biosynthesis